MRDGTATKRAIDNGWCLVAISGDPTMYITTLKPFYS